jgi:hypothetical protein
MSLQICTNTHACTYSLQAGRIEGKSDFPESFTDFNCTLDLRLEHNIISACENALRATEFEERKLLDSAEMAMSLEMMAAKYAPRPVGRMAGNGHDTANSEVNIESVRSPLQPVIFYCFFFMMRRS